MGGVSAGAGPGVHRVLELRGPARTAVEDDRRNRLRRDAHQRQLGLVDINAGQAIGAGDDGKPLLQLYGRTASTVFLQPIGNGNYNAIQARVQRRFADGFSLGINYTWGKGLSVKREQHRDAERPGARVHEQELRADQHRSHAQRRHHERVAAAVRAGRAHLTSGVAGAILGGWQINNMVSIMSGAPFTVTADDTSLNLPGSTQTADQVKPDVAKLGAKGADHPYYDQSAFADVTEARFGNSGYNTLRGPGLFNWDFGLTREFTISKSVRLQFRMEAFNFTNTPHLALPDNSVGDGADFMTITDTQDLPAKGIDERQFRLGFRSFRSHRLERVAQVTQVSQVE